MEKLVVVNKSDQILGTRDKITCHRNPGVLHRGFAAFVLNNQGEILLTKRSKIKPLWPLYWENTCSSHPRIGESYVQAGERRLLEELGFTTSLKYLFKFYYQADYNKELSEHEVCAVLLSEYLGEVKPNAKEVADIRWVSFKGLQKQILKNSKDFAPWLILALELIYGNKKYKQYFERGRIRERGNKD